MRLFEHYGRRCNVSMRTYNTDHRNGDEDNFNIKQLSHASVITESKAALL